MTTQLTLPRRSLSTEAEHREWLAGVRKRRPLAPGIAHLIVHYSDGSVAYRTGTRYNVRRAYADCPRDLHIVNLRLVRQPLHLLTA